MNYSALFLSRGIEKSPLTTILTAPPKGISVILLMVSPRVFSDPTPANWSILAFPFPTFTSALKILTSRSLAAMSKVSSFQVTFAFALLNSVSIGAA